MPTGSRRPPPDVNNATPMPASAAQTRSSQRRDPIRASASGPENSIVTATPSGMRAMAS